MNIVQITPGAGGMFCGGCLRDNALVAALRKEGHQVLMVPLYLPLTLDEPDQSSGAPLFFGGINVYLDQQSRVFRGLPEWLKRGLNHPRLLQWSSRFAARTRPEDVGDLTLSMLRGEEGNQAQELDSLIRWLRHQEKPDVVNLSNVLLIGMARRLKEALGVPLVCTLQGEDAFLDALPPENRAEAWAVVRKRCCDIDRFIAPSQYFGHRMRQRIEFPEDRLRVVPNGINLDGYADTTAPGQPPVLGYFGRMCLEKGLDDCVKAFVLLKKRPRTRTLRLKIGGSLGPADQPFVDSLRSILDSEGLLDQVEFCPNLSREEKIRFLRSLTVFSTPALYGESFGLYVLEALAAAVPVVQPRHAAFPELIRATGGGILSDPLAVKSLAGGIESLILDPDRARQLGTTGRQRVRERFSVETMARGVHHVYRELLEGRHEPART